MRKTKTVAWTRIDDSKVRHVWVGQDGAKPYEITVPPTFYFDNGTPIDDNGDDMTYVRTEILA